MENDREYLHSAYGEEYHTCKCSFWKHLLTALMTLLGAFLAFYFVTDWHYKRMLDPAVQMRKMDKMLQRDENYMDKMANKQIRKDLRPIENAESFIRLERGDKNYKIIVDLRPFDNNEKNVDVSINGNVLTINAAGETNRHGHERILKISQSYMFDDDIDLKNMTKMRQGKDLIIYVPTGK